MLIFGLTNEAAKSYAVGSKSKTRRRESVESRAATIAALSLASAALSSSIWAAARSCTFFNRCCVRLSLLLARSMSKQTVRFHDSVIAAERELLHLAVRQAASRDRKLDNLAHDRTFTGADMGPATSMARSECFASLQIMLLGSP
jgi:hypothetical protein